MTSNQQATVDHLGEIKAQIAELEAREKAVRDEIASWGKGAYEGDLFRATVSIAERELVDWKAVAMKLEPSRQLITAHTTTKSVTTVKSSARTGQEVAA